MSAYKPDRHSGAGAARFRCVETDLRDSQEAPFKPGTISRYKRGLP